MEKRYEKSRGVKPGNNTARILRYVCAGTIIVVAVVILALAIKHDTSVLISTDQYPVENSYNASMATDTILCTTHSIQNESTECNSETTNPINAVRSEISSLDFFYPSRTKRIPATICVPGGAGRCPLVVFIHGFGGDRNQGGGFSIIAETLLDQGIASIRMDFSGCGESTEPFSNYCLSAMKEDVLAAIDFMVDNYGADCERIGLIGYSLGGRVALELVADEICKPYAMLLIAPAAETDGFVRLLGGSSAWQSMKREAELNGVCHYEPNNTDLGIAFFEDFLRYDNPASAAADCFSGRACVVYAKDDMAVNWRVSQGVADCLGCSVKVFENGGHATGLTSKQDSEQIMILVNAAAELFG